MQRLLVLLLVFACATANSQVFRRIGPDGQVYFSDQPGPGAERVDVTPAQTISLPPVPEQTETAAAATQGDATVAYAGFSITSPTSDQGVRANDGNVTVHLSLQPALQPSHSIVLNVDGEDGESTNSSSGLMIELNNLSRGKHTVMATVVDEDGKVLIKTEPVTFQVLRVAGG
jgi:hypothetical protein